MENIKPDLSIKKPTPEKIDSEFNEIKKGKKLEGIDCYLEYKDNLIVYGYMTIENGEYKYKFFKEEEDKEEIKRIIDSIIKYKRWFLSE
jgi:hypothetical protein